ncbi:unnamed protein product [Rhizoctonia solani]|uniref:GNAT family acetyltransferase n=1 Tax=Rhizoctonia solani TaxID=456999 RepID=A0A8H3BC80_9AGAM|nr:GNAT family acetyltransferase [Rhizoctonia solani]KAF8674075.1 zinc-finger of acetyl-transferase ESCO [Rhizoctonia solani]QRW18220.1 GNAT family acetyltransferase [Rhizoctonia solani]CAE6452719.1 unnamed protein product [Rhizoctonia solani]
MSSRQASTPKTYSSRSGACSDHKGISQSITNYEDSSTVEGSDLELSTGRKASVLSLKRKSTAANNLHSFFGASQPTKRLKLSSDSQKRLTFKQSSTNGNTNAPTLTQLHFLPSKSILITCKSCDLSYTRGAHADEELHRVYCLRIARGMEWSRDERSLEKPLGAGISDVELVEEHCALAEGVVGRILRIRCDTTKGKLGQKVTTLLSTINKVLSAPPLPDPSLKLSKAYVMVVPTKGPKSLGSKSKDEASAKRHKSERIVGCVITTPIAKAMRIVDNNELEISNAPKSNLVCVDIGNSGGNVYCDPSPVPATLGIPRLFVVPSHRRQGIARALLDAAAKTAIWGCSLNPNSGQIAFSQPTASGHAIMKSWGGPNMRIYEE